MQRLGKSSETDTETERSKLMQRLGKPSECKTERGKLMQRLGKPTEPNTQTDPVLKQGQTMLRKFVGLAARQQHKGQLHYTHTITIA